MLRYVWVNNFRSLDNFSLKIEPGLNVLVGPNGAGKTSIMKWFEFLSLLSSYSLRESIGKIGGANHVFRRKDGKYLDDLSFAFIGSTELIDDTYTLIKGSKYRHIYYEYNGRISFVQNQIFFSRQETRVWISKSEQSDRPLRDPEISIIWNYDILTNNTSCDVKTKKPKDIEKSTLLSFYFEKGMLTEALKSHSTAEYLIMPNMLLPVDYIYMVKQDLSYRKAYNINPAQVRSAIDISSQPGVHFDGAGTVSTIYDIKSDLNQGASRYTLRSRDRYSKKNAFSKVLSYFKLSDVNIDGMNVSIDNFRNEFTLEVTYSDNSLLYSVPISLLSDGTVKWLALVTALATEQQSFFIEEPENFLHPKLQENIVEIIREEISNSATQRFALVTTHSETLLNKLRPQEIIVASMVDGRTQSERIEDPEEISRIISESGFGLGYFYVSGGF